MGKYDSLSRSRAARRQEEPHPIWRGIGCFAMVIIPLISFAVATVFIDLVIAQGWPFPIQLLGTPQFPDWAWETPQLAFIPQSLSQVPNLYGILFMTVIFIIVLSGLVSLGYAFVYRFIGPSRYGPLDAPPPKGTRPKPYKR
jgi:hypothetical protein